MDAGPSAPYYKLTGELKIGNKTVLKNNNPTLYDYSRKNAIYSLDYYKILKILKFTKNRVYILKFQINDCFENFTHKPIVFVRYFINLSNIFIKFYKKIYLLFHSFFSKKYTKISYFLSF